MVFPLIPLAAETNWLSLLPTLILTGGLLLLGLGIVYAIITFAKEFFMVTAVPFFYNLGDRMILPVVFVRQWIAKKLGTGFSWAGKKLSAGFSWAGEKLGATKRNKGEGHSWHLPKLEDWGGTYQLAIMIGLFLLVVAAIIHQAVSGTLAAFIDEGIDALPITYAFSLIGGESILSPASLIEVMLFNLLALVLMRRVEDVSSGVVRYTYEIIFLLFSVVLVQYIPQAAYEMPEQLFKNIARLLSHINPEQNPLLWAVPILYIIVVLFTIYLFITLIVFALREVLANLVFSVWPTVVMGLITILAMLAKDADLMPLWIILLLEVVGVLLCSIWFTHIRVEEEDLCQEVADDKLRSRFNALRAKQYRIENTRLLKVQLRQLRRWKRNYKRYVKTGVRKENEMIMEDPRQPQDWVGCKVPFCICDERCPYFKAQGRKRGKCTKYEEKVKRYQYCEHKEFAKDPVPTPNLTIEEVRYKEGGRLLKRMVKWTMIPGTVVWVLVLIVNIIRDFRLLG